MIVFMILEIRILKLFQLNTNFKRPFSLYMVVNNNTQILELESYI